MVPGQLKEVCVTAEGELERTVSVNMSVMEQHGITCVYCRCAFTDLSCSLV